MPDIETLNEAIDAVNSMSRDPKVREMIRQREFAEHEKASLIAHGVDKKREKIIANMRKNGMTEEQIQNPVN